MNIEIYRKQVYGKTMFYIKDPKIADAVHCLTGQKTLTSSTVRGLRMLGFTLHEALSPEAQETLESEEAQLTWDN